MNLYQTIKSAETIGVFDAAEALGNNDVATACQKLTDAKARYERKHARSLARAPDQNSTSRDRLKAETRRRKVHESLAEIADCLAALEKTVKIRRAVPKPLSNPPATVRKRGSTRTKATVEISSQLLDQFQGVMGCDDALTLLRSEYDLQDVESSADIAANSVFVVASKGKWHLLRTPMQEDHGDTISLCNLLTRKCVSVSKEALVEAGGRKQAMRLRRKDSRDEPVSRHTPVDDEIILDESELVVLWSVVRDTRLLTNAAEITLVQKNEFKRRQYDRALKKMLILRRSFDAAVRVKRSEFARELAMLQAQKQNLPLREIEKRKLKVAREKRLIERAEARFTKVMNGLHALDARRS